MRIYLHLADHVVSMAFECDDDASAEHHFQQLEKQLQSGRISFSVGDIDGRPPELETVQ